MEKDGVQPASPSRVCVPNRPWAWGRAWGKTEHRRVFQFRHQGAFSGEQPAKEAATLPGETREMSEQARKCIWGTGRVNDPENDRKADGMTQTGISGNCFVSWAQGGGDEGINS